MLPSREMSGFVASNKFLTTFLLTRRRSRESYDKQLVVIALARGQYDGELFLLEGVEVPLSD